MTIHRIDGQRGHVAVELLQLGIFFRQAENFRRTNGGKIGRVGKQDGPLALFPRMKRLPVSLGRIAGEIGDDIAEANDSCRAQDRNEDKYKSRRRRRRRMSSCQALLHMALYY